MTNWGKRGFVPASKEDSERATKIFLEMGKDELTPISAKESWNLFIKSIIRYWSELDKDEQTTDS